MDLPEHWKRDESEEPAPTEPMEGLRSSSCSPGDYTPETDRYIGTHETHRIEGRTIYAHAQKMEKERNEARQLATQLRELVEWSEFPAWEFPWENAESHRLATKTK